MDTRWSEAARETHDGLKTINLEKMTKDDYLLYGASLAILDHEPSQGEVMPESDPSAQEPPQKAAGDKPQAQLFLDYIGDELSDADKYLSLWNEMGDEQFREMARDEIRHSENLIRIVRQGGTVDDPGLQDMLTHHNVLLARLV